jgi:hypothetical protein
LYSYSPVYRIQSFGHASYDIYSTPNIFNNYFSSSQLPGKTLSLGRTLSLNILQLVGNINVQGHLMFIKETISYVDCVTRFLKINIRHLLVNYLNISEKHVFDMPKFDFMSYNNIIVPRWVDFDRTLCPKRGVVEASPFPLNRERCNALWPTLRERRAVEEIKGQIPLISEVQLRNIESVWLESKTKAGSKGSSTTDGERSSTYPKNL